MTIKSQPNDVNSSFRNVDIVELYVVVLLFTCEGISLGINVGIKFGENVDDG